MNLERCLELNYESSNLRDHLSYVASNTGISVDRLLDLLKNGTEDLAYKISEIAREYEATKDVTRLFLVCTALSNYLELYRYLIPTDLLAEFESNLVVLQGTLNYGYV